jgi:hypothetical protein
VVGQERLRLLLPLQQREELRRVLHHPDSLLKYVMHKAMSLIFVQRKKNQKHQSIELLEQFRLVLHLSPQGHCLDHFLRPDNQAQYLSVVAFGQ